MDKKPKLLEQIRLQMQLEHKSLKTQKTYLYWIKRYILWSGKKHPATLGAKEVSSFLSYLADKNKIASSTQNQALNALI